jgi:hypothetical protein
MRVAHASAQVLQKTSQAMPSFKEALPVRAAAVCIGSAFIPHTWPEAHAVQVRVRGATFLC